MRQTVLIERGRAYLVAVRQETECYTGTPGRTTRNVVLQAHNNHMGCLHILLIEYYVFYLIPQFPCHALSEKYRAKMYQIGLRWDVNTGTLVDGRGFQKLTVELPIPRNKCFSRHSSVITGGCLAFLRYRNILHPVWVAIRNATICGTDSLSWCQGVLRQTLWNFLPLWYIWLLVNPLPG